MSVNANPFIIQKGQTLGSIALEMKKKDPSLKDIPLWGKDGLVARLQKANGIEKADKIKEGQALNMDMNSILGNSFGSKPNANAGAPTELGEVTVTAQNMSPKIESKEGLLASSAPEMKLKPMSPKTIENKEPIEEQPLAQAAEATETPETEKPEAKKNGFLNKLFSKKPETEAKQDNKPSFGIKNVDPKKGLVAERTDLAPVTVGSVNGEEMKKLPDGQVVLLPIEGVQNPVKGTKQGNTLVFDDVSSHDIQNKNGQNIIVLGTKTYEIGPDGKPGKELKTTDAYGRTRELQYDQNGKEIGYIRRDAEGNQTSKLERKVDSNGNHYNLVYDRDPKIPTKKVTFNQDGQITKYENFDPKGNLESTDINSYSSPNAPASQRSIGANGNITDIIPDVSTGKGAMKFSTANNGTQMTMKKDNKIYILNNQIKDKPDNFRQNQDFLSNMNNWQEFIEKS